VNFHDLVSQLLVDTKGTPASSFFAITADSSVRAFLPELILCATVLLLLFVRLFEFGRKIHGAYIALAGAILALYFAAPWEHLQSVLTAAQASEVTAVTRMEIFTGMLVYDTFSVYVRSVLLVFAILFILLTRLTGIPDLEDGPDIYSLFLGATLGMCLMSSANHLLTIFMAVEMASVPSYVLAGLMKGRRQASEAALKYSIYGAGTAGVMLYGISLLGGLLNTCHLPTMAAELSARLPSMTGSEVMVLVLAGLMVSVGLAFKLSAVPFHFWCPDVFEGATAEVNAFLSVASKAAALALLIRVALGVSTLPPPGFEPGERTAMAASRGAESTTEPGDTEIEAPTSFVAPAAFNIADEPIGGAANAPAADVPVDSAAPRTAADVDAASATQMADATALPADKPAPTAAEASAALEGVRSFLSKFIAFIAVITCTFGNLAAYGQHNIKRMLAYSTIAHAGYMMMAVSAVLALAGIDHSAAERAVAALAVYVAVYLFMNLGAFAVVAFLRNAMRSEEIADYAGLVRRAPLTVVCFALILFSLIGLPPLSGFIGKFAIFASLVEAYQMVAANGGSANYLLILLIVAGLNTAISLIYYLNVAKVMTIDPEPAHRRPFVFSDVSLPGAFLWLITLPTIGLIINWNGLNQVAMAAARYLFV
jgi:NADH-quinone oxidoreductase subunit N